MDSKSGGRRTRRLAFLSVAVLLAVLAALAGLGRAQERTAIVGPGAIRAAQRLGTGEGWVLTDDALLVTHDGGATWSDVTPGRRLEGIGDAFLLDSRRGWLAGVDPSSWARIVLLETADGGTTWREQVVAASDLGKGDAYARAEVRFADAEHGWLLGRRATSAAFSAGELLRTRDGGLTWERLPPAPAAERFVFIDARRGFMLSPARDRLHVTRDGGGSWTDLQLPVGDAESAAYDLPTFGPGTRNGVLPVTLGGKHPRMVGFVTSDGGLTWRAGEALALRGAGDEGPVPSAVVGGRVVAVGGAGEVTLSFADEVHGWAVVAEGVCDDASCRQETRLVSLDGGAARVRPPETLLARQSTAAPEAAALGAIVGAGRGFDKCAAATAAQMQTWFTSSPYRSANIYYGGNSRACSQPNLTSGWVQAVFAQGWGLIPTWVGPQAPCTSFGNRFSSNAATARSQGLTEAASAVDAAVALGLTAGTPLYYDLENYNEGNSTCAASVRAFVNAWVEGVKARQYVAGVYGTAYDAGHDWIPGVIANPPDAVWLASWACTSSTCSFTPTVWDVAGVSNSYWADHQRLRQYWGGHNETYGGVTFNIDSNAVDGPVAAPDDCRTAVAADRWKGEYFANPALSGSPALVRDDGAGPLDFDWGAGGPSGSCGVGADGFSARWMRTVAFTSGTHRFTVTSDDGFRLYVDGALRLERWFDQAPTTHTVDVALAAGNHTIAIEYYENAGGAVLKLSWEPIGVAQFVCDDGDACLRLSGPSAYWHRATTCGSGALGYGGDMYWTYVNGSALSNSARWTPALGGPGVYEVSVFVPRCNASSQQARYRVVHQGALEVRTVNQNAHYDAWVSLGTFAFAGTGGEYVELSDATGESYATRRRIGVDAIRWLRR